MRALFGLLLNEVLDVVLFSEKGSLGLRKLRRYLLCVGIRKMEKGEAQIRLSDEGC